jgi:hypothetical protein
VNLEEAEDHGRENEGGEPDPSPRRFPVGAWMHKSLRSNQIAPRWERRRSVDDRTGMGHPGRGRLPGVLLTGKREPPAGLRRRPLSSASEILSSEPAAP